MTTKLLPRLIATGALAAGLALGSAATGLATAAHATTPPAPTVTKGGTNGSVNVFIGATDLMNLQLEPQASYTCSTVIVPASSGVIGQATCTQAVYDAAKTYARQHISVNIDFKTDGTYTTAAVR
jgi:hypothetical protein